MNLTIVTERQLEDPVLLIFPHPAPSKLLSVTANLKSDPKRYSCKKHGLDCSFVCGECHGLELSNASDLCTDENDINNLKGYKDQDVLYVLSGYKKCGKIF